MKSLYTNYWEPDISLPQISELSRKACEELIGHMKKRPVIRPSQTVDKVHLIV